MEKKEKSPWKLVATSDLPVLSVEELENAERKWVEKSVWFYIGSGQWRLGRVSAITRRGLITIEIFRNGAWVHGRVISLEYVPRVLRLR